MLRLSVKLNELTVVNTQLNNCQYVVIFVIVTGIKRFFIKTFYSFIHTILSVPNHTRQNNRRDQRTSIQNLLSECKSKMNVCICKYLVVYSGCPLTS